MFFRNLTFMRFPKSVDFSEIESLIEHAQLKPVGPLEMTSRGFISPYGRESTTMVARSGSAIWLSVGTEQRMLPATVINDEVAKRIEVIEEREARRPGGRERKRIKDDVLHELMPRAFVKRGRVDVIIDTDTGVIAVDTGSRKAAEDAVSDVRGLLGSFPAMPLNAEIAPRSIMTSWVAHPDTTPAGLQLGDEAELSDPMDGGAKVRATRQELASEEIANHLDAGKQCTKLALNFSDHVTLVLGDDLACRKVKFLDGALEQLEESEGEGRRAELDARFALQAGEIRGVFRVLEAAFKISSVEA